MDFRVFIGSRWGVATLVALLGLVGTVAVASVRPTVPLSRDSALHSDSPPTTQIPVASECPRPNGRELVASDTSYYYPPAVARGLDAVYANSGRIYTGYDFGLLHAMRELPLWCGTTAVEESYRFLLIPSFHSPIGVRIDRTGSDVRLHAVMLSGPGGGSIAESTDVALRKNEWDDLLALLKNARIWQLPATKPGVDGTDGTDWMLEGRKNNGYRVVERHSPELDDAFAQVGLRFLDLAKMREAATEL